MNRRFASLGFVLLAAVLAPFTPASSQGQAPQAGTKRPPAPKGGWRVPRTADGQADLQGIWMNNAATPLERPAALAGRTRLTPEEVAELKKRSARIYDDPNNDILVGDAAFLSALNNTERYRNPDAPDNPVFQVRREFDDRTSIVVVPADGRIPFSQEGRRRHDAARAARNRPAPAEPAELPGDLRCITWGVPRIVAGYNSYFRIVQARDFVVLFSEVIHDARIIPLDGRAHLPQTIRQWHGDSRGRWDGDTLVVETTNFSRGSYFLGSSDSLHLTERLTRVAEDTVVYEVTARDLTTWTEPWTAEVYLKRSKDPIFEFACHEGNLEVMSSMLRAANASAAASTRPR